MIYFCINNNIFFYTKIIYKMSYEQQMHEYVEQRLSNCLYYKDWIETHEEEIKECKQLIEDKNVDEMDKEYCATVLNEYKNAIEEINKNINDIDMRTKYIIKLTKNEQEIYNILREQKYIIL